MLAPAFTSSLPLPVCAAPPWLPRRNLFVCCSSAVASSCWCNDFAPQRLLLDRRIGSPALILLVEFVRELIGTENDPQRSPTIHSISERSSWRTPHGLVAHPVTDCTDSASCPRVALFPTESVGQSMRDMTAPTQPTSSDTC